jgi:hypothetical protein
MGLSVKVCVGLMAELLRGLIIEYLWCETESSTP